MAHDLEQNQNGEYEMFVAGEPAWHHLGKNVEKAVTWKDAMKLAGLDWYVQKRQLQYKGKDVEAWANFRADSGKFLGAVGPDYQPIQNVKGFEFTNTLLRSHNVKYESAGVLGGGTKIWLLAQIPKEIRIAGTDDITKPYFLFMNPHDGSRAAIARTVNKRVVCNNTLQVALKEQGDVIRIIHTGAQENQIKDAQSLMDNTLNQLDDFNKLLNTLAKIQLDMKSVGDIVKKVYKNIEESVQEQNRARMVLEIFEDNDNNAFPKQRGTAYNLLNAFTKYEDHFSSARLTVQENEQQARARKALFGIGDVLKFQVLTAITQTIHENSLAKIDTNIVTL